ncbi:DUF998 domain-containing protein [Actinomyces sp. MRS3W]|uniref:DUF998 domain-containing protein n=1 Tax=Actinomyces sp. MRS3W TaxID=2800796 RepID=UPI0028FD920B|nr:DUF998 domain-containing protein [Actinomyces sp. MRS3W]MDU0348083.1 DUF998 domain-containing protein [Actinomyces sp. MRS3W]
MRGRLLALAAFVTYNGWLAWGLTGDPHALAGYLSELAAQDQPYQWFFRLADTLAAVVFTWIAILGRDGWRPWLGHRAPQVAGALVVAAAGTVLDAVFNLPCAQSRDAACIEAGFAVRVHEAASVLVSLAFLAGMVLTAVGLAQRIGWTRGPLIWAALTAVVAVLMLTSILAEHVAPGTQGFVQAIYVLVCSAWVARLALRLPGGKDG